MTITTISTDQLLESLAHDAGLHLLNVQGNRVFAGDLIPGSRHVPVEMIEYGTATVPKDVPIVTYSSGPDCPHSRTAAERLVVLGYRDVRVYAGGVDEWKASGGRIVRPERPPAA